MPIKKKKLKINYFYQTDFLKLLNTVIIFLQKYIFFINFVTKKEKFNENFNKSYKQNHIYLFDC